jgi:hypothetical protein
MTLASITCALALLLGGQGSHAGKPARSLREGGFLITARRVWVPVASSNSSRRFHSVVVEVTVKNVSRRVSAAGLGVPWLKVTPEMEYMGEVCNPDAEADSASCHGLKPPETYQMLPGEQSTGAFIYKDVRNGTTPVALVLHRAGPGLKIIDSGRASLTGLIEKEPAR